MYTPQVELDLVHFTCSFKQSFKGNNTGWDYHFGLIMRERSPFYDHSVSDEFPCKCRLHPEPVAGWDEYFSPAYCPKHRCHYA